MKLLEDSSVGAAVKQTVGGAFRVSPKPIASAKRGSSNPPAARLHVYNLRGNPLEAARIAQLRLDGLVAVGGADVLGVAATDGAGSFNIGQE